MKKMLTGIVLCASLCVLASCSKNAQKMNVKQTIDAAKNMSHDELVAKAKEEAERKAREEKLRLARIEAEKEKARIEEANRKALGPWHRGRQFHISFRR